MLIELPSNDGKIVAVNPHYVTACQRYVGYLQGRTDRQEMTAVWVGANVFVCAWKLEHTVDLLNDARQGDLAAFAAGADAGRLIDWDHVEATDADRQGLILEAFKNWIAAPTEDEL